MGVPYAEVIGDPIEHSKSPLIHKFWLETLGLKGEYRRTRVAPGELSAFLEARRRDPDWRGCSLTMPHKESVIPLLDGRKDYDLGAVNCIVPTSAGLIGHNTDLVGVDAAVGTQLRFDDPICIIGAGGAASAVPLAVDWSCVFTFHVIVRDQEKGRAFLKRMGMAGDVFGFDRAAEAMRGVQGVVNASPLGMAGFPDMPDTVLDALTELPRQRLREGWVVDMVYSPLQTRLLQRAQALGLLTEDGLTVLIGQAAAAFKLFFGKAVPSEHLDAVRPLLVE
ncbi:MAG: shikimate dehydrogenase [Alphaproteobacteria bacterium]|nr:MAG: shikimate dehydrogenase [Alphaproteobacteria bacterium]